MINEIIIIIAINKIVSNNNFNNNKYTKIRKEEKKY